MPITITTWNVQNFARSQPVFEEKLNFLIGTLQALDSDVVALQEVLDLNALQASRTVLDSSTLPAFRTVAEIG